MPKTFAEKALARAAGLSECSAGDILDVTPDLMFSHDNTAPIRRIFEEIGATKLVYPERTVFTLDHAVPAPTTKHAQNHAEIRQWAKDQGVLRQFEVGRGICHQVISEEALILPGETILGSDSHTPHFGWLGAFGAGIGRTEMAALWATGRLWMRVPESMKVVLSGQLRQGTTAKDIALKLIGLRGVDGGIYRSIEFSGDTLASLSSDDLPVLPNMMAEFGAKNAYLPPDDRVFDYLEAKRTRDYTPLYPDPGATYADELHLDINDLEPQIALPHNPDNVVDLSQALGQPIQQAFLGTCTNGRLEDIQAAAQVVKGHKVAVRFIIIPASSEVLLAATRAGYIETLLEAGATLNTPGCGPCMGNHMGIPAPNESTISTGNRNFRGRMGTREADIYLSNPYVVAASAISGAIADPREFLP
jgi:3-isopropylmalate dehydratase large subunit